MSLKAPFVDLPGRKKNVLADDTNIIGTLASSETVSADNSVNPLDGSPLFGLPPSHADAVPSFPSGAPADDTARITATKPVDTGSTGSVVSSVSNATTVIGAGTTVELSSAYSGAVYFAGDTGTLKIDNSSSFSGTIAGQLAIGDVIDLADISAGANAKISYSGNESSGTLTVSDGTNTASIALKGNYSLADFTVSSDGHGGTNVVDPPTVAGFAIGANGLPIIAPQSNSRVIYVSSSTGSDSNTGLSPNSPLKTIAAGEALLRNGYPDQLLLKAGDTFVNQSIGDLTPSGQSATAPMLIGTYGTGPAPIVESPANNGDAVGNLPGRGNFVVVEGIDFYAYTRDPSNPAYAGSTTNENGAGFFNTNEWVLLAGDTFSYYSLGILLNSGSSATTPSTVTLYKNVVTNSWSTTGHSQGLYASGVGNLVIEQNIFDHNGWNASIPGAQATIFNRNVYLNGNNGPVTFVGNISANSSSEGIQARSGGTVSGNLFVADSAGFSLGENPNTSATPFSTLTSTVATGNVVLNSNDIQSASGILPRSDGIVVNNASGAGVQVTGNIVADPTGSTANQSGISLNSNVTGITATNNIIYGVAKNPILDFGTGNTTSPNAINASGYVDPTRTVQTYDANVLGGPGTLADFLAQAEAQPNNPALTAAAVNAYIQAGFTLVVNQTGPKINSVVESPSNGDLNAGDTVTLTLNMASAVTVAGGTPTLSLNDGGIATYTGGSGTNALTFSYTVGAGQNTAALAATAVNLNGATVKDGSGNAASLSLTGITQSGPQIDTSTPVVSAISETPSSGSLNAGKTVAYTITMSEAVTVNTTGGSPTLALNDGGTATYVGGSGTNALTFSYTVQAGQNTPDLMASAFNLNGATMADGAGNAANVSLTGVSQGSPAVDTTPPTVSSVSATAGSYNAGKVLTLTLNMSEAVNVTGTPTLTLNDGGSATYTGGSGSSALTFSYTVASGQNSSGLAITAVNGTITDLAGNALTTANLPTNFAGVVIDTTTPSVSSVAASGTGITAGSGDVGIGTVVTLTVNLNEAVTVAGGTPTLTLNDGGTATYTGGSGSNALTFSYTVAAGQNTADLAVTAVSLNSASVKNGAGTAANLTGAVGNMSGTLQISTSGPTVSSVVTSGTGITAGAGDLAAGSVVTLTVNMSSAVTVAGGTPTLTLNDGGTATYTGGSGSNALTFSYTVAAGQNTADLAVTAVGLNSATIKDSAGNIASLTGAVTNPAGTLQIDTTTPSVSSVVASGTGISAGSGDVGVGSVVTLTLNMSEAVTVAGGTPSLTLNDGGTATYTGGTGTNALTFSYTVAAGQSTADLAVTAVNLNSANVVNGAGTAANLTGAVTSTSGTLQIDTTTPSVSSVVASGTGITAGSGDIGVGSVVTLTVNLNEAVTVSGGTPTLTLNDGGTATYTGGSGSNALTFNYTVAAGQSTADLAVTAVNLNSATVKNGAGTAANLAAAVGSLAGTLQIDTTTPSVSSVVASGSGITAGSGDLAAGSVVTLTVNLNDAVTVAGGTPTLTLNDGGAATYTGGSGSNALTFSYTVGADQNTADLAVTGVNLNSATIKNGAGTAANLTGAVTNPAGILQIDTAAPTVSSVVTSGTGITAGSGDLAAGSVVTLTVNLSSAVTVAGGTPTLTLNDGGTATYTGGSGSSALTFRYTVGSGQNTADLTVTGVSLNSATVTDGAGNAASLAGAVTNPAGTLQIDTNTPTLSSITESPANGHLKAGKTVTLTLNMSEAVTVAGGTPTLNLNDGASATYTGGSGTNALTFRYTVTSGQNVSSLAATTVNLNGATIKNGAGTVASFTTLSGLTQVGAQIDTTIPTVTQVVASPGSGVENPGDLITLTVDMNKAVTVTGTPTLTLNDGATATYTGGSGTNALTFSYTVAAADSTVPTLAVTQVNLPSGATVMDAAGNVADLSGAATTFPGLSIDPPPIVVSVSETPSTGDLGVGKTVTLTLKMNDVVTVTGGTPTLALNDGGIATYIGGSGTNALSFRYTVGAGDNNTASLAATGLTLNGATVQNSLGDDAIFLFNGVTQNGPQIDANTPTVTSVVASGAGITAGTGDIPAGTVVTLTLNLSEAVTVTGGAPNLTLNNGGTATYAGGSGSNVLTFTYTVATGQNAADLAVTAFNPGTATITNGAGTAANLTGAVTNPAGTLQIDTSTHLAKVGKNYFFNPVGGGTGPEFKYNGAAVTSGEFGAFTPIGAVQTASGYDVAWKNTATGLYTVWLTDANGNFLSQSIGGVSGTSTVLEQYETVFNQDLNGDGKIGVQTVVIQIDGSTSLVQVGANYFFNPVGGGTGPEFKYNGAAVTAGEFGAFTPIGAVQTASGYDVAWKNTSSGLYTVWLTDRKGNFLSQSIGGVSGTSTALETMENTFQQDLNGDGVIGIYAAPGTTLQVHNRLSGPTGSATIGAGATLELAAANSSSVTFTGSTGMLKLDSPSTFDGVIYNFTGNGTLSSSDQIDLKGIKFNSVSDSYSNGVLTVTDGTHSAALDFNGSFTLANFKFASDGSGGTILYDPPGSAGQGSAVPAEIMHDPAVAALDQQLALFSQHMASAFPSSALGNEGASIGATELAGVQQAQIAQSTLNQQHV